MSIRDKSELIQVSLLDVPTVKAVFPSSSWLVEPRQLVQSKRDVIYDCGCPVSALSINRNRGLFFIDREPGNFIY